jgi:site-specific DNA-methyltransferase (adenine-specific)
MKLINADCIEAMKAMPDNSVDSIVTDPPYELGFMGKSWDASGIAFNVEVWQEALRVIKPGGHLIAFSGSRTYHRMAVAIEDAGFQIRDQIMWVYGSGFPKSHNISKGIDKASDFEGEVIGTEKIDIGIQGGSMHAGRQTNVVEREVVELSPDAAKWQGWGTALKPAHEPMVLARKPLEGTVANNVLTFGVGGLNIDGTRVGYVDENDGGDWSRFEGYQPSGGDFQKVSINKDKENEQSRVDNGKQAGRFPANFIHDGSDEVVALFPDTGGGSFQKSSRKRKGFMLSGSEDNVQEANAPDNYGDSGSAARFFYCAKASKRDRNEGLDGFEAKRDHDGRKDGGVGGDNPRNRTNNAKLNHHPTVKPTSLMQYLIRLVTPPNGIVLDPFMGSGSTGKACAYEGFDFIGIDQSAEYVAIAQARIDFALADKSDELPL